MARPARVLPLVAVVLLLFALPACTSSDGLAATAASNGLTICEAASLEVGDRVEVTARFKGNGGILLGRPDPDVQLSEDDYTPSSLFETEERCREGQEFNDKLIVVGATPAAREQLESLERGSWSTVVGTIEEIADGETQVVLVDAEIAG